jgi:hypothetical protein
MATTYGLGVASDSATVRTLERVLSFTTGANHAATKSIANIAVADDSSALVDVKLYGLRSGDASITLESVVSAVTRQGGSYVQTTEDLITPITNVGSLSVSAGAGISIGIASIPLSANTIKWICTIRVTGTSPTITSLL